MKLSYLCRSKMKHFALIGYPLTHSYSKQWFDGQHFPQADYRLCPMSTIADIHRWVALEHIDGFNVTAPHKCAILPLLDHLTPEAKAIGAVNCVTVNGQHLVGHNTDAPAFQHTLAALLNNRQSTFDAAFILGTGGAARAVAYALKQMGIAHSFVSRHPDRHNNAIGYNQLPALILHHPSSIIVNATPVGMYPDIDRSPLPLSTNRLTLNTALVYDLVYNPSPTLLMQQANQLGAKTKDGLEMLHLQARLSWQLWGLE